MKSRVVFISMLLLLCFQCIYGLGSGESGTAVVPSPDRSSDGADLRSSVSTMVGTHIAMFHQENTDKVSEIHLVM